MNVMLPVAGGSFLLLCVVLFQRMLSPSRKAYSLILAIVLLLLAEWATAQGGLIRQVFLFMEALALLCFAVYAFINRAKMPTRYSRIAGFVLVGLVFSNLVACLTTYGSIEVFIWSIYDTCKYFSILFAVMAMGLKKSDLKSLCVFISFLVVVCFGISLAQFLGIEELYDPFRGQYEIRTRSGAYRAIGFFPYPIELGNWAAVMFALVYGINRSSFHLRGLSVICALCVLMTVFSGTRTSMAAVIAVYALANLHSFKTFGKAALIAIAAILCLSTFMPWEEMLTRLNIDMSEDLPRQYYFSKGLEVWLDYPLFGIGYGTYGATRYREMTQDYIFNAYNIHRYDSANLASTNSFLSEVIPEFGIAGILMIAVLVFLIVKAVRFSKSAALMCTPALIAGAVLAVNSSTVFSSPHIGFVFWMVVGLLFSFSSLSSSDVADAAARKCGRSA